MFLAAMLFLFALIFAVLRGASRTSGRKITYAFLSFATFAGAIVYTVVLTTP